MEDHHYATSNAACIDDPMYTENIESSTDNVIQVEEKEGDDYLIELYRERRYLYDKSHQDFKNKQIKENAWCEISIIMQQKNLGKHYTPEYCQMRCTSLRDQYSRKKRNIKNDYKNGSACSKRITFAFFSQLSFLDNFIKRRKSFSNVKKQNNVFPSKDKEVVKLVIPESSHNIESIDESDHKEQDNIKMSRKRDINAREDTSQDKENFEQNHDKQNKKTSTSKFKKYKIDERKNIDDTFANISNSIMKLLESPAENTTNNNKTIDQSFADYVRIHLEYIPEPEKSERKKMIIDALTAPLRKT